MKTILAGILPSSERYIGRTVKCSVCGFEGILEENDNVTKSKLVPSVWCVKCPTNGCDKVITINGTNHNPQFPPEDYYD